ncbi:MAG: hypothetical protein ACR2P4_06905 [Gammaproteobacteria bacterium]
MAIRRLIALCIAARCKSRAANSTIGGLWIPACVGMTILKPCKGDPKQQRRL